MPIAHGYWQHIVQLWVAAASASLPMVCPFAIGKAFGLADATQRQGTLNHNWQDDPAAEIRRDPKKGCDPGGIRVTFGRPDHLR
jgi:hypothetical protein